MNPATLLQFQPKPPWQRRDSDDPSPVWDHPDGDVASFHFFPIPPDLVASPDETGLPALRQMYRDMLRQSNGGIVSVDATVLSGVGCVALVIKIPMQPHGMLYVSSVTIPFRDFSFVAKFQCPESGTTGVRDSVVFAKARQSLEFGADGLPKGWQLDPYLGPSTKALYNLSDKEEYDSLFPNHPLSRARKYLRAVPDVLAFDAAAATSAPFGARTKPWWRPW